MASSPAEPLPAGLSFSISDLAKALKTLPSCQRCKRGRRRCDTSLPSCNRCQRANEECLFYDHALKQVLPRSYVHSLIQRVKDLEHQKRDLNCLPQQISTEDEPTLDETTVVNGMSTPRPATVTTGVRDTILQEGHHFPVTTPHGPTMRHFGPGSILSLAIAIMFRVRSDSRFILPPIETPSTMEMEPPDFHGGCNCTITKHMVEKSVQLYVKSIHCTYPFLDARKLDDDLEVYWQLQDGGVDPTTLKGQDAHQFFRIKIIAAIASASRSRYNASRIACDHGCYLEATKCIPEVTSEVSVDSLQALLLLIIYCLFRPRKGDIWKLLDYAGRLSLELGYNTEPAASLQVASRERQKHIFWSLFSLESMISEVFGRPSNFPDSIVTVLFPTQDYTLYSQPIEREFASPYAVQHYSLLSIRAKLTSDTYMRPLVTGFDQGIAQEHLASLDAWYNATQTIVAEDDVGFSTCLVAFHASVLSVFQPLVTKHLKLSENQNPAVHENQFLPNEVFLSAGRIIEIYENILRASRDSSLGTYPLTLLSAHHIYLASMMIMAYCYLYLEGRVAFQIMISNEIYMKETSRLKLDDILQLSNSCLLLLTFCGEKWPGMVGMRDSYRQLSDQLVKHVYQRSFTDEARKTVSFPSLLVQ